MAKVPEGWVTIGWYIRENKDTPYTPPSSRQMESYDIGNIYYVSATKYTEEEVIALAKNLNNAEVRRVLVPKDFEVPLVLPYQ